jgi:hypothetical protein
LRARISASVRRKLVNHRPARISEPKQLRDFIKRLARRVIARLSHQLVRESGIHLEKMGMPPADNQRDCWKSHLRI